MIQLHKLWNSTHVCSLDSLACFDCVNTILIINAYERQMHLQYNISHQPKPTTFEYYVQ